MEVEQKSSSRNPNTTTPQRTSAQGRVAIGFMVGGLGCDAIESLRLEDRFRPHHWILQVKATGGAVAKFVERGVVSVDLYLVLVWFKDHVAQP